MNFHDAELLSAYLDGELSQPEVARLEARLASDPDLRRVLDDLRISRGLTRRVRRRRAPRSFVLHPGMAKLRAPEPQAVPAFRLASALASFLFLAALALNGLVPFAAQRAPATQAPAYGMGGGMGGGPAATEAPAQALAAAPSGTPSAELTEPSQDLLMATSEAAGAAPKIVPPSQGAGGTREAMNKPPVPLVWELVLATAALVFGWLAWYLRRLSQRSFRSRWIEK